MRPEILFPLYAPASGLKGVGPKLAPLVARAAGPLVRDLLFLAPAGLVHRTPMTTAQVKEGETPILKVQLESHLPPRRRGQPYRIRARDETGFIFLTWFKVFGDSLVKSHPEGALRVVSGKVDERGGERSIAHPDYLLPLEREAEIPKVETVYPTTAGLPSRTLRRIVLAALEKAPDLPEWQDAAWRARNRWPSWREALKELHSPQGGADLEPTAPARQRLAYDELLAHQLAMALRRSVRRDEPTAPISHSALADALEAALPFRLTGAQRRALAEIGGDLAAGQRMARLLHGDVGSGKTVAAMLVMAEVAAAGGQSALMAPTEILARQHFETIAEALEKVGIRALLLTGRDKGAGRAEKLAALATGEAMVAVGTHALFQDDVAFKALRLSVIDEQHRFGVAERKRLQAKGEAVHLLALSATPIPRTLELTQFGDMEVSRLDEKPPGRQPVTTTAAPLARLPDVVERLRAVVQTGGQAFWICPLVSESELLADVTAAEDRASALKEALGADRVGLIHGQMPPAEKDEVMAAFASGRLAVLVATTVVEVGVNVPKATIMVIEHAERFGLAQLHQLRGRVGRGTGKSACLLLYQAPLGAVAKARIEVLRETEDGFVIAEQDLALRGGGDLLGLKQSGFPAYRLADPTAHRNLILAAADDARLILARDPELTSPRGRAVQVLQALFDWRSGEGYADAG
jgi:ATP-dependent DNA helicase RecG